jgi:hypothetical protein
MNLEQQVSEFFVELIYQEIPRSIQPWRPPSVIPVISRSARANEFEEVGSMPACVPTNGFFTALPNSDMT